jgi:anti-sigma-K factor RskA
MKEKSCSALERLLVEYADGELDREKRALVEDHLKSCPACRRAVQEYRQTLNVLVEGIAEPPPGRGVALASIEQRAEKRLRQRRRRLSLVACGAIACLLLLAGIAFQLDRGTRPGSGAVTTANQEMEVLEQRIAKLEDQVAQMRDEPIASTTPDVVVLDLADLEYEEVAAICLAAAIILEEEYGNVEAALERYRYATRYFPETTAGRKARTRIKELESTTI